MVATSASRMSPSMPSKTVTWDHFVLAYSAGGIGRGGCVLLLFDLRGAGGSGGSCNEGRHDGSPEGAVVIRACSLTDFTWSPSPSVTKVAASAVLFGEGACVDAWGSVAVSPALWRWGGGAFTFRAGRAGIQLRCPAPLGLGPAAMLGGGCCPRLG